MKNAITVYHDFDFTQPHQIFVPGVAALHNGAEISVNWSNSKTINFNGIDHYVYIGYKNRFTQNQITLSGGQMIYSNVISDMIPNKANFGLAERTINQNSASSYINAFFCAKENPSSGYPAGRAFWIGINGVYNSESSYTYNVSANIYYQNTIDNPTSWNYDILQTTYIRGDLVLNDMPQTKIYRCVIDGKNYYMLAFSVNGNTWNEKTWFVAFPKALFDGTVPETYPGPETESNSESAYSPTIPYRGSVLPRDLTDKRNPYGFNAGNGLSLAILSYEQYAAILQGIYAGTAESVLNKIAQGFAQIVGGNTHRPIDEVNAIINAILSCHMIPQITGYASGTMNIKTIAGYHILGGNGDSALSLTVYKTANTIFNFNTSIRYITRRLNSFLDFEPYTSIQLHLPFMPVVDIKPSILYGNGLYLHYTIDIYTGILSCDVMIVDNSENPPREFIYTTMQTNAKTQIPVVGNAANASAFAGITSAIIGAMGGKDDTAIFAAGVNAADDLSKISTGNAAGKTSVDGIGAYLSNRQPYLVITRPRPANPPKYAELNGFTSNMSGIVGDFTGYAVFESVDLSGINATDAEKKEIESMLKGGVFV